MFSTPAKALIGVDMNKQTNYKIKECGYQDTALSISCDALAPHYVVHVPGSELAVLRLK